MLPIRDNVQSKKPPIVTIVLIAINSAIFIYEVSLGTHLEQFMLAFGFVPTRFFHLLYKGSFLIAILPLFASIFLHGGWLHVIGNMWFLWIFGDNVEDRMGHVRFIFFYLLCGIVAGLAHAFLNSRSGIPTVGASGAIAGVMGAYFILYPKARIWTLVPIFFFVQFIEIPAFVFLGFWVLMQLFVGAFSMGMGSLSGGVAWWAHVGGFIAGVLLVFIFKKRERTMPKRFVDEYRPW